MRSINILPEDVIAKIAAGEVIERPASVVKELLENSIDAGADRISIRLEKGGKKLIRVVDNGVGMSKEDLYLCIRRHATSKISSADDLFHIRTLGFRGEAIPSIAAVSRLIITSKPHDQLVGHRIQVEGGEFISLEEAGTLSGTIVDVKDLFFNLPVRRKFLRSDKTELDHIIETVIRTSFCNLGINISLEHGKKTILSLPPSDGFIFRFSHIFGEELMDHMLEGREVSEDMVVTAFLSLPQSNRTRADRLFFYVNGRAVKDKLIMRALMDAYGERLMKGEYPQGGIFINMDPGRVDFNVHPTKQEVRFQEEGRIYRAVYSCIKKMLGTYLDSAFHGTGSFSSEKEEQYVISRFDAIHIIGQLGQTYIICEDRNGILLVDQHAAHERILYEKLKHEILHGKIESQRLLEPHRIEFNHINWENIEKHLTLLSDLGVEIEPFGGNTFLITSYPAMLEKVDWPAFIEDVIKDDKMDKMDDILKIMACHAAVKAGDPLSKKEMETLLEELYKTELPTNCPHGRPVLKQITYTELERMFKRVV